MPSSRRSRRARAHRACSRSPALLLAVAGAALASPGLRHRRPGTTASAGAPGAAATRAAQAATRATGRAAESGTEEEEVLPEGFDARGPAGQQHLRPAAGQAQGGGRRDRREFVGPMDHSYRIVNGNIADGPPSTIPITDQRPQRRLLPGCLRASARSRDPRRRTHAHLLLHRGSVLPGQDSGNRAQAGREGGVCEGRTRTRWPS